MLDTIFATKREMTQVWTKQGKRLPVTRCRVDENVILGQQKCLVTDRSSSQFAQNPHLILEIGYGKKKLKNTTKPLRTIIEKSGFSFGFKQIKGVRIPLNEESEAAIQEYKVGKTVEIDEVLSVGDVVKVQGISKGRGFSGVIKRHGMSGGPKTQGQSDRSRAVGSIGSQTPGKVWKGKRMPGHFGVDNITIANLTVIHIDPDTREVWLNGPVPGHINSIIKINKTGKNNKINLNFEASGIKIKEEKAEEKKEDEIVEQAVDEVKDQPEKITQEENNKETKSDK